jgi:hypothetical protein
MSFKKQKLVITILSQVAIKEKFEDTKEVPNL